MCMRVCMRAYVHMCAYVCAYVRVCMCSYIDKIPREDVLVIKVDFKIHIL